METFTEELKREYLNALYNQQSGYNSLMLDFKKKHEELFCVVNAMYHKRKNMRENIYAMKEVSGGGVVFGALTFDEEHIETSDENKRKQATRYMNQCFDMFLFVEELGHENERYHIHFIGVLKPNLTYTDFHHGWHSRSQIEKVISIQRSINYLTDYIVKQVPRIRRNKKLVEVHKHWQKSHSWMKYGFEKSFARTEMNDAEIAYIFDL